MAAARHVMGLDLGTSTGWAVLDRDGGRVDSGRWRLDMLTKHGWAGRLEELERLLVAKIIRHRPARVGVERIRFSVRGVDQPIAYGRLLGVIERVCHRMDVELIEVSPGTVKLEATGKGNAQKEDMVAAANERWGLDLMASKSKAKSDDDEADALWVASVTKPRTRLTSDGL